MEWKFLRLLYKRETSRKMDELVGENVSEVTRYVLNLDFIQYILGALTDEFDLVAIEQANPMYALRIFRLFSTTIYHWCFDTAIVPHERYRVYIRTIPVVVS